MVATKKDKKKVYLKRVADLVQEYPRILLANADNVTSMQFHRIRAALRGKATVLMGKNTLIKKSLREALPSNPKLERLITLIKLNVCLIFTNEDLNVIREVVSTQKVAAPARVGAIAPCDVIVKAGATGLEPTKTQFFQAVNIGTKISKNQVDILSDVKLIKEGDKVGNSEATLLKMLKIEPFSYGLQIHTVYDNGTVYPISILDISDEDMAKKFAEAASHVSALALGIGYPCLASFPHALMNAFSNLLSISLETDYEIEQAKAVKEAIAMGPIAAKTDDNEPSEKKGEESKEEEKKEEEEESDEEMGFGLFGDD